MGIVKYDTKISVRQFDMIKHILLHFDPSYYPNSELFRQIYNIIHSTQSNNDILITHGVHYTPMEQIPHFNIKIRNRGRLSNIMYHVYVLNYYYGNEGFGYNQSDGTITLLPEQIYYVVNVTQ